MVVTCVDTSVEVCAVVMTVVWVCILVCVVCTEVTAVEVVRLLDVDVDELLRPGAPGGGGGGAGGGGATVDGGFSGGTIVSAGLPALRTIEFDGAAAVGKGSAAAGGGAGGADGAAFPLPTPSLPLPLPSSKPVLFLLPVLSGANTDHSPPLPSPPLPLPCRRTNGGSTVSLTTSLAAFANSARATLGLWRRL